MIKKAYLIHGWDFNSKMHWYPWVQKELEKKGVKVFAFDMPDTENPKIEKWVKYLEQKINPDDLDEHTYFIGHSIGCQTILRYLEKLHKHKRVGGCVFVAPWLKLINLGSEEMKIAHPWMNSPIDFSRVSDHCNNFLAIFSDNDPYVHMDEAEKFKKFLGAQIIIKKKQGHFDNSERIPEAIKFVK